MPTYTSLLLLATLLAVLLPPPSPAADEAPSTASTEAGLTGNWGGARDTLEEEGYSFKAVYKGEYFSTEHDAASRKRNYEANYDLILDINGEKAWDAKGVKALVYILGNEGHDPNEGLSTAQGVSNIAAPPTWKLYQLWADFPLWGDLSVLVGLYDVNSEFDTKKYGGVFLNPTHGIGPDFSQSGENGPSIFPTTSAGARLKMPLTQRSVLQFAWLDGVPGDPANPRGNHFRHPQSDGYLNTLEWNWTEEDPANSAYKKFALGTWRYSESADGFDEAAAGDDSPKRYRGNAGFYAIAEAMLLAESPGSEEGLGGYVRWGKAATRMNQLSDVYAGALNYTGLLPGRSEDVFGLGLSQAVNGRPYRQFVAREGGRSEKAESILEVTYKAHILAALALQLDWQFIKNPGMDPAKSDAQLFGLRLEAGL